MNHLKFKLVNEWNTDILDDSGQVIGSIKGSPGRTWDLVAPSGLVVSNHPTTGEAMRMVGYARNVAMALFPPATDDDGWTNIKPAQGMSLLDYFTGQALLGAFADSWDGDRTNVDKWEFIATQARGIAHALIRMRNEERG